MCHHCDVPSIGVKCVHLDNAKELSALVGEWILAVGGKCGPTLPYTLEYNGVIENMCSCKTISSSEASL